MQDFATIHSRSIHWMVKQQKLGWLEQFINPNLVPSGNRAVCYGKWLVWFHDLRNSKMVVFHSKLFHCQRFKHPKTMENPLGRNEVPKLKTYPNVPCYSTEGLKIRLWHWFMDAISSDMGPKDLKHSIYSKRYRNGPPYPTMGNHRDRLQYEYKYEHEHEYM